MKGELLNLYQLKIFKLTIDNHSHKKAADLLGITPSAVSQTLTKLEHDLGVDIFVRGVRPLRLTAAGQALLKGIPDLLETADSLRRQITDRNLANFSLRLGMSESVTSTISPWLISALKRCVLELDCQGMLTKPLIAGLRTDKLNLAVMPDGLLNEDRWERNRLYEEDFLLVTTKDSPEVHSIEDFRHLADNQTFISYSNSDSSDQIEIERILRSLDIHPQKSLRVTSSYALIGLVSEMNGWAVVPPTNIWCGRHFATNLKFQPLPEKRQISRTMWAVCDRNLYAGRTSLIGEIVKLIFSENMMPQLEQISSDLVKHVRLA